MDLKFVNRFEIKNIEESGMTSCTTTKIHSTVLYGCENRHRGGRK